MWSDSILGRRKQSQILPEFSTLNESGDGALKLEEASETFATRAYLKPQRDSPEAWTRARPSGALPRQTPPAYSLPQIRPRQFILASLDLCQDLYIYLFPLTQQVARQPQNVLVWRSSVNWSNGSLFPFPNGICPMLIQWRDSLPLLRFTAVFFLSFEGARPTVCLRRKPKHYTKTSLPFQLCLLKCHFKGMAMQTVGGEGVVKGAST